MSSCALINVFKMFFLCLVFSLQNKNNFPDFDSLKKKKKKGMESKKKNNYLQFFFLFLNRKC